MWTQFLKPKLTVILLSRAEFSLKQIQEDRFNVRSNAPLTINNATGTNKLQNSSKRNTLHRGNLPSIKKYLRVVHNTKNITSQYSYKNKFRYSNVTGDLTDEDSTENEETAGGDIMF